jgi:hypothetical protein
MNNRSEVWNSVLKRAQGFKIATYPAICTAPLESGPLWTPAESPPAIDPSAGNGCSEENAMLIFEQSQS